MASRKSSAGRSETGLVRKRNEDAILLRNDVGLWAVADGLGGHDAGDLASRMVVERLASLPRADDPMAFVEAIEEALRAVNEDLRQLARQRGLGLIGSTVVLIVEAPDYLLCGWVGDSRAYALEHGILRALTLDHVAWVPPEGAAAPAARPANLPLSRAIGAASELFIDWAVLPRQAGLRVLLCSDGINKEIVDEELQTALAAHDSVDRVIDALIATTMARGARDNASAVVVAFDDTPAQRRTQARAAAVWDRCNEALSRLDAEHCRGQLSRPEYQRARRTLLTPDGSARPGDIADVADGSSIPPLVLRARPGVLQAMMDWLRQRI